MLGRGGAWRGSAMQMPISPCSVAGGSSKSFGAGPSDDFGEPQGLCDRVSCLSMLAGIHQEA
jgi:hypothetical protein